MARFKIFYKLLIEQKADFYYARIRTSIHLAAYLAAKKVGAKFIIALASDLDALSSSDIFKNFYSKRSIKVFLKHLIHTELVFNYLIHHANKIISQHHGQANALFARGIVSTIIPNMIHVQQGEVYSSCSSPYFVYISSLDKRKGLPYLIQIVQSCPAQRFKIIGRCRDDYATGAVTLLELNENADYLGSLPHDQVLKIISGASFLISTSPMEGFPNIFLEAWSYGIPVLSLYVDPGNIFSNNELGLCFNGNLADMISFIKSPNKHFNRKRIMDYVFRFHDPVKNIEKFIMEVTNEI